MEQTSNLAQTILMNDLDRLDFNVFKVSPVCSKFIAHHLEDLGCVINPSSDGCTIDLDILELESWAKSEPAYSNFAVNTLFNLFRLNNRIIDEGGTIICANDNTRTYLTDDIYSNILSNEIFSMCQIPSDFTNKVMLMWLKDTRYDDAKYKLYFKKSDERFIMHIMDDCVEYTDNYIRYMGKIDKHVHSTPFFIRLGGYAAALMMNIENPHLSNEHKTTLSKDLRRRLISHSVTVNNEV